MQTARAEQEEMNSTNPGNHTKEHGTETEQLFLIQKNLRKDTHKFSKDSSHF